MNQFLDNKYTSWYLAIVEQARQKSRTSYVERHHIIPKSLGGSDNKNNLVHLTAREHFICHLLLPKMLSDDISKRKMYYALHRMMFSKNQFHEKRYIPRSSIFYEQVRIKLASGMRGRIITDEYREKMRKLALAQSPESLAKRSASLKGRTFTDETRAKMSHAQRANLHNRFVQNSLVRTQQWNDNISKGKRDKATKWSTLENRTAVSLALMNHVKTPEHCANISKALKGKISQNKGKPSPRKGVPLSEETKQKMRKPKSEEMKQRLREYYQRKRDAKSQ